MREKTKGWSRTRRGVAEYEQVPARWLAREGHTECQVCTIMALSNNSFWGRRPRIKKPQPSGGPGQVFSLEPAAACGSWTRDVAAHWSKYVIRRGREVPRHCNDTFLCLEARFGRLPTSHGRYSHERFLRSTFNLDPLVAPSLTQHSSRACGRNGWIHVLPLL